MRRRRQPRSVSTSLLPPLDASPRGRRVTYPRYYKRVKSAGAQTRGLPNQEQASSPDATKCELQLGSEFAFSASSRRVPQLLSFGRLAHPLDPPRAVKYRRDVASRERDP